MQRRLLAWGASLAVASAAGAEEPPAALNAPPATPLGIDFSLRVGPAATSLPTVSAPLLDLWLRLGYRFGGWLYVGVAGVYGAGTAQAAGGFGGLQTPYNAQVLTELAVHPLRYAKVDPYLGYGLGAEWFNGGTGNFIPVSVSVGVDFALAQTFRVGPFFAFQVAFRGNDTHPWYVAGLQLTALP